MKLTFIAAVVLFGGIGFAQVLREPGTVPCDTLPLQSGSKVLPLRPAGSPQLFLEWITDLGLINPQPAH